MIIILFIFPVSNSVFAFQSAEDCDFRTFRKQRMNGLQPQLASPSGQSGLGGKSAISSMLD